jgi:serine/threonine protein kinase/Tol biopolymer transport system component
MTPGKRYGPYEIIAPLGAGGMGEVYRARDERLERVVAVKILSGEFGKDPTRLHRFEQEAKTLASLNHPNIMVLFDTGIQDGTAYLVSELLEGKTLRDELATGPLSPRKAADYALQIARGLAAAHNKGIVHRDLKPENLFVTKEGSVKILDFGLAKAFSSAAQSNDGKTAVMAADSATAVQTEAGMILGTPGYMAPEQIRGQPADHRADLFAFGAILYEMLSGQRAFRRESSVQTMNAVLTEEPPELSEAKIHVPPGFERAVRRCLEKDPARRFQSASDLAFAVETLSISGVTMPLPAVTERRSVSWSRVIPWAIAAIAIAGTLVISARLRKAPLANHGITGLRKFEVYLPRAVHRGPGGPLSDMVISPDGRKLAYINGDGLWVRTFDHLGPPNLLSSAEKVHAPFWSPDSIELAYFEANRLFRIAVAGGKPALICRTGKENASGVWLDSDKIVLSSQGSGSQPDGIYQVYAKGGELHALLTNTNSEAEFRELATIAGTRAVLLTAHAHNGSDAIEVFNGSNGCKVVFELPAPGFSRAIFAAPGYILFERRGENRGLWGFSFSTEKSERTGEPFRLSEDASLASSAPDGMLVYHPSGPAGWAAARQMVWVDRAGHVMESIGTAQKGLRSPRISPDGTRIVAVTGDGVAVSGIWLFTLASGVGIPLTHNNSMDHGPYWMDGGQRVLFTRSDEDGNRVLVKNTGIGAPESELFRGGVLDVARNGRDFVLGSLRSAAGLRYAVLDGARRKFSPLPQTIPSTWDLKLSPDGKWLAYVSEQTGHPEVNVVPVPTGSDAILVSRGGGRQVQWNPSGTELFYLSLDGRALMAVSLKYEPNVQASEPTKLFDVPEYVLGGEFARNAFDVSPDGQRFLMIRNVREENSTPVTPPASALVVLNWSEEFRHQE